MLISHFRSSSQPLVAAQPDGRLANRTLKRVLCVGMVRQTKSVWFIRTNRRSIPTSERKFNVWYKLGSSHCNSIFDSFFTCIVWCLAVVTGKMKATSIVSATDSTRVVSEIGTHYLIATNFLNNRKRKHLTVQYKNLLSTKRKRKNLALI